MREILFKAKATDNGEWVEGSLINAFEYTCILQSEDKLHPTDYPYLDGDIGTFDGKATPIIPETVGQYTGLTDKNGRKIFEGDIVSFNYDTSSVKMTDGCWGLDDECTLLYDLEELEVIGNVHDNPELIGGEPE